MTAPVATLPPGNGNTAAQTYSLQREAWKAPASVAIPEVEKPKISVLQWQWQWDHKDGRKEWTDYDARANLKIEAAFQNGQFFVRVKSGKDQTTPMELYFAEMVQIDRTTSNKRRIQRVGPDPLSHRAARRLKMIAKFTEFGRPTPATRNFFAPQEEDEQDGVKRDRSLCTMGTGTEEHKHHRDGYSNGSCGKLARSITFYAFSVLMVLLNVGWLGYEANNNDANSLYQAKLRFIIMENVFCVFFAIELLIRFCAYRRKCDAIKDLWWDFDLLLVILAIGECYIIPLFLLVFKLDPAGRGGWAIFRLCRMMKVARLARVARLLRHFPQMMVLARGILEALRAVLYTAVLLAGLLYVFGIIFKTQTGTNETLQQFFPTVQGAMWLLMLEGILMDGPKDTLNEMTDESVTLTTTFLVFIFLSAFLVMNMLIGIVCNVVDHVSKSEEELASNGFLRGTLMDLLECYDKDGNRMLTRTEFEFLLKNPEMNLILEKLGVDQSDLLSLKEVMFDDSDNNWKLEQDSTSHSWRTESQIREKELPFKQFISIVFRLRGANTVRVGDLVELREFVKLRIDKSKHAVQKRLDALEEYLGKRPRLSSQRQMADLPLRMAAADGSFASPPLPPDSGPGVPNIANVTSLRDQLAGIVASQQALETRQQAMEQTAEARLDLLTAQIGAISSQMTWLCDTLGKAP